MLLGALMTLVVAACFSQAAVIEVFVAWAKIGGGRIAVGDAYTTMLRGIPDLLIIYLSLPQIPGAQTRIGRCILRWQTWSN
jgi:octopine/nopaline transport system permease protein